MFNGRSVAHVLAELTLNVLAIEELTEEHLVLGNGKMIQHQRHRPLYIVAKGKTLQSG